MILTGSLNKQDIIFWPKWEINFGMDKAWQTLPQTRCTNKSATATRSTGTSASNSTNLWQMQLQKRTKNSENQPKKKINFHRKCILVKFLVQRVVARGKI